MEESFEFQIRMDIKCKLFFLVSQFLGFFLEQIVLNFLLIHN